MLTISMIIIIFLQASVSTERVREFLKSGELDPGNVDWSPQPATSVQTAASCVV